MGFSFDVCEDCFDRHARNSLDDPSGLAITIRHGFTVPCVRLASTVVQLHYQSGSSTTIRHGLSCAVCEGCFDRRLSNQLDDERESAITIRHWAFFDVSGGAVNDLHTSNTNSVHQRILLAGVMLL